MRRIYTPSRVRFMTLIGETSGQRSGLSSSDRWPRFAEQESSDRLREYAFHEPELRRSILALQINASKVNRRTRLHVERVF